MLNLSSYPPATDAPARKEPEEESTALEPATPRWALVARAEFDDRSTIPLTPTVRRLGQTRAYVSALGSVREGLHQGERLIVVTGASGTGKTTLCRALIEEPEVLTHTSVMLQPPATPEDLLAHFLRDVGVLDNGTSAVLMTRNSLVFALQRFLESLIPIGGRAVLVIDEAQHLTPAVLEQVRLALNFETADSALLQVVLVGQPELDALLRWPELERVAQRVSRRCELTGIAPDEFSTYLDECVQRRSPGSLVRLTPAAEKAIVSLSRGVPRLADRLSTQALDLAAAENAYRIEPKTVTLAAQRLGLETSGRGRLRPWHSGEPGRLGVLSRGERANRRWMTGAAAVATCAIVAGGIWGWTAGASGGATAGTVAAGAGEASSGGAATAAPAIPTGALETAGGLTVTVASFRTESRARAVVAKLVDEGFPAFARSKGETGPYQVIVGPYVSAEEAVAAQKSLAAQGAVGTEVRIETADLSRPAWQ